MADVIDEFAEIDEVFWSVVQNLPPDSPFLRHLARLLQDNKGDKSPRQSGDENKANGDGHKSPVTQQGDGDKDDNDTEANAEYVQTIRDLEDAFDIDLTSSSRFDKREDGLYINHTCPDSPDYFLEAKTPPTASEPPEEEEATL